MVHPFGPEKSKGVRTLALVWYYILVCFGVITVITVEKGLSAIINVETTVLGFAMVGETTGLLADPFRTLPITRLSHIVGV